jgi:(2Fe-2S) ferredoxin
MMMPDSPDLSAAREEARRRDVGGYERHIFLCTGPDCCTPEEGMAAWQRLKKQVGELNKREGRHCAYRTKVGCLRICTQGPTAVVYPEGAWYAGLDNPAALDRIVEEHLGQGRVVEDYLIGSNPLPREDGATPE